MEIFEILNKYIPIQEQPSLSLPILALVTGAIFFQISIWFDKHERFLRWQQLSREQLLQKLLSANYQIIFFIAVFSISFGFRIFNYCMELTSY